MSLKIVLILADSANVGHFGHGKCQGGCFGQNHKMCVCVCGGGGGRADV